MVSRIWRTVAVLGAATSLLATILVVRAPSADADPDQSWIVVLAPETTDVPAFASILSEAFGGEVEFVYEHALKGFSVSMTAAEADRLARSVWVDWVEPDGVVSVMSQETPHGLVRVGGLDNPDLLIDGIDNLSIDVDVAVLDTGIDLAHPDLNVAGGVDCTSPANASACIEGGDDDHFHGTHVGGTIGALDNDFGVVGIAPGARIWSVKVLDGDGSGSTAAVIAGIDWVTAHADTIEVANMSFAGFGHSQAQYEAVQRAVDAGVAFAVSAGNDAIDASYFSPAAFDNVLTVSALADYDGQPGGQASPTCGDDPDDTLAAFSNHGFAVEITAPGTCIRSTVPLNWGSYGSLSGTSMAAPHVAGAMALLAAASPPTNAFEVHDLYRTVIDAGLDTWTDTSGDGWIEPLLDVSRFSPANGLLAPPDALAGSGDVNCDQTLSIIDALVIAQYETGSRYQSETCAFDDPRLEIFTGAGDINGDARVNIIDALLIARCVTRIGECPEV